MFLMSYGYNPSSQRQNDIINSDPVVGAVMPPRKVYNESDASSQESIARLSQAMNKTVLSYLGTVKKRAEITNDLAKKKKLPYRLKVYPVAVDKVFMDVVIVNDKDEEVNRVSRDVTNADFDKLIDNISEGSGLLFDN